MQLKPWSDILDAYPLSVPDERNIGRTMWGRYKGLRIYKSLPPFARSSNLPLDLFKRLTLILFTTLHFVLLAGRRSYSFWGPLSSTSFNRETSFLFDIQ
jgi:hypothetical protein